MTALWGEEHWLIPRATHPVHSSLNVHLRSTWFDSKTRRSNTFTVVFCPCDYQRTRMGILWPVTNKVSYRKVHSRS